MARPPGGYFGRALIVNLTTGQSSVKTIDEPVLRSFVGGAGLGAWLMHECCPPGVDAARPRGAADLRVLTAGRHPADDERQVRGGREVPAHGPVDRRAGLQPLRDRRQAHRARRDRRARLLRRALGAHDRRQLGVGGARRGPVGAQRRPRPRPGCASGWDRPGGWRRSGPPASASSATPPSPTTAGTPAVAVSAPCWAPSGARR